MKKRITALLLLCCLLLSSCMYGEGDGGAGKESTAAETTGGMEETLAPDTSDGLHVVFRRVRGGSMENPPESCVLISDTDGLNAYLALHSSYVVGGGEYDDLRGKYDEEFFKTHLLAVGNRTESSGSIGHEFGGAEKTSDAIVLTCLRRTLGEGMLGTCDVSYVDLYFELLRAEVGDAPKVSIVYEDKPRGTSAEEAKDLLSTFSGKLLSTEAKLHPGENVFLSPLSAAYALTMAGLGAKGKTLDELESLFGKNVNTQKELLSDYFDAVESHASLADSMWISPGFTVKDDFMSANRDKLRADVKELTGIDPVNEWINEKTKGLIPKMLEEPLSPDVRLLLVNALHFSAEWAHPFDDAGKGDFTCADGKKIQCDYLLASTKTKSVTAPNSVGFTADYNEGGCFFMALLPKEGASVEDAAADLTSGAAEFGNGIRVKLPKLELSYDTSLVHALQKLGVSTVFGGEADLTGISDRELYISDILHKTVLKLDMRGTSAAAATVIVMPEKSAMIQEAELVFDRPFALGIFLPDGTPLFVGIVNSL